MSQTKPIQMTFAEAIRDALRQAMFEDDSVFLMGEGIDDHASFFGTTRGLASSFGKERVVEMPIAENGLTGIAIGAALAGRRPVLNFHRVEFALLAFEQIVNNAAKAHYTSRGEHRVPLVIRLIVGRGWGQGPEHAQSLESVFSHFPGLRVLIPTFPDDAKGMLLSAIRDDNPVVMIEHRWLHNLTGDVSLGPEGADISKPRVVREGRDATVVASSHNTLEAIRAADKLAEIGCKIEVVDLRVTRPLDTATIRKSLSKTGYLVCIDLGWQDYGISSEVISRLACDSLDMFKAPPQRLGIPDHPVPSSRGLIQNYYPSAIDVCRSVGKLRDLDPKKISKIVAALKKESAKLMTDVPDPFFKGPF